VGTRSPLRRAVTALAMGAAAAASLVLTAPSAVAAPQVKLIRLLDQCDKPTFDAALPGLCTRSAGSVTFQRFSDDLLKGGNQQWWINNRNETINAGDTLHVVDEGGILHTFTEVKTYGSGVVPPFNVAVGNAPPAVKLDGTAVTFADIPLTGVAPGTSKDITPAKGVHLYQCIFHPWMRTVVTVR
jgi:plastocyanin